MNKITTTAGLLALGAVGLQAQVYAPAAGSQQATKPWTVSASLRGFYDSNYTTSPKRVVNGERIDVDSYGFEVSPSASLNLLRDQTSLGLNYTYSLRWFEDRADRDQDEFDHAHLFNAKLSHAFTPRYKLDVTDSFAMAQEPEVLNASSGAAFATPLRSDGDNLRNVASGSFSAGITENLDAVIGYANTWVDYDQEDGDTIGGIPLGFNSRSSVLDRIEHLISLNLRQVVLPNTIAVLGYQYEIVDYTSPGLVGTAITPTVTLLAPADSRDFHSHYFYAGVDQRILQNLNASLRGGVQYTEYDNLGAFGLLNPDDHNWSPYVDANATWVYLPGSYAQLGVRHQRNPTDVASVGTFLNPDAEATTVYGSINQRFLGQFVASLIAQYQHSSFDVGGGTDPSEDLFVAGINLSYEINKWLAAEVGYNYDRLSSDVGGGFFGDRSFTRNRVYAGIRGTF